MRSEHSERPRSGSALLEVMVATLLVAVALYPMLEALGSSMLRQQGQQLSADRSARLQDKLDAVMAMPYSRLYAETTGSGMNTPTSISPSLSDAVGPDRRVVIIYRSTGNSATPDASDTGLLHVRVAWADGGPGLESLKGKWW